MEIDIKIKEKTLWKINEYWFKRVLIFIFIMASARASTLFSSDISMVILMLFSGSLYFSKHKSIDSLFIGFIVVFGVLMFVHFLYYSYLNFSPMLRAGTAFFVAYFIIKLVGEDLYKGLSDIIAYLALISLPIFALSIINFDMVFTIVDQLEKLLPISETRAESDIDYANFIFYTVWQPFRNQGFMWEPGAFGAILSIAMFFNMIYYRFTLNWKLIVIAIAMITTVSTTAILLMGILFVFFVINRGFYWFLPVIIMMAIYISRLDIVGEKIVDQITNRNMTIENEKSIGRYNDFKSLGRFGSMVADVNDLKQNYLFGIGFQYELRTQGTYIDFAKTNGLTDYLLKFGILGMLFFVLNTLLTAYFINKRVPFKLKGTLLLINLTLAFSNPVLFTPLWLSFQIFYVDKVRSFDNIGHTESLLKVKS